MSCEYCEISDGTPKTLCLRRGVYLVVSENGLAMREYSSRGVVDEVVVKKAEFCPVCGCRLFERKPKKKKERKETFRPPKEARLSEAREEISKMRGMGMTWKQISDRSGVPVQTLHGIGSEGRKTCYEYTLDALRSARKSKESEESLR